MEDPKDPSKALLRFLGTDEKVLAIRNIVEISIFFTKPKQHFTLITERLLWSRGVGRGVTSTLRENSQRTTHIHIQHHSITALCGTIILSHET